jgi:hypothetical protein
VWAAGGILCVLPGSGGARCGPLLLGDRTEPGGARSGKHRANQPREGQHDRHDDNSA